MNDNQNNTTDSNLNVITPIQPIKPIQPNEVSNDSNNNISMSQPAPQAPLLTPNIIMPEIKGANQNTQEAASSNTETNTNTPPATPVPSTPSPEGTITIDTIRPFDIGVTGTSNVIQPADTSTAQTNITPITVNSNNNDNSDNINNTPDINIAPPTNTTSEELSIGTYITNLFLFTIPVIGFVFLVLKALDKKNKNLSTFAKAYLIYTVAIGIFFFILVTVLGIFSSGISTANMY